MKKSAHMIFSRSPLSSTKEPSVLKVDDEKAKSWIANGAQPTDTVKALLKKNGVIE